MITYDVHAALTDTVDGFGADVTLQHNHAPVLALTGNQRKNTYLILDSHCNLENTLLNREKFEPNL